MSVDERAQAGLFLAMQYPVEVPGVSMSTSCAPPPPPFAVRRPKLRHWVKGVPGGDDRTRHRSVLLRAQRQRGASRAVRRSTRCCNSDCSSRRTPSSTRPTRVSTSTRCASSARASIGFKGARAWRVLLITHYTRILRYIKPDFVHVFVNGRIVESAGPEPPTNSRRTATSGSPRPLLRADPHREEVRP